MPAPPITQPPAPDSSAAAADAVVGSLMAAFNNRDWDTVRRINPAQSPATDETLTDGYRSLEQGTHVVLSSSEAEPGRWTIIGTIIVWDYRTDGSHETNIACETWDVDRDAGTATQSGFFGFGRAHEPTGGRLGARGGVQRQSKPVLPRRSPLDGITGESIVRHQHS